MVVLTLGKSVWKGKGTGLEIAVWTKSAQEFWSTVLPGVLHTQRVQSLGKLL